MTTTIKITDFTSSSGISGTDIFMTAVSGGSGYVTRKATGQQIADFVTSSITSLSVQSLTGSLNGTASFATNAGNATTATSASYATNADQLDGLDSTSFARLTSNNTFNGINQFTTNYITASAGMTGSDAKLSQLTASTALFQGNITVQGTASIAQLNTVNQTSLVVGDKYITILSGGVDHTGIDGAGILWGTSSGPGETTGTLGEHAHVLYDASRDALKIFPGLYVSGSSTVSSISGTTAEFTTITASIISASQYIGLVGGGSNPAGPDKSLQFNSGSQLSGSSNLIYDYNTNILSGTTAQFTTVSASKLAINTTSAYSSLFDIRTREDEDTTVGYIGPSPTSFVDADLKNYWIDYSITAIGSKNSSNNGTPPKNTVLSLVSEDNSTSSQIGLGISLRSTNTSSGRTWQDGIYMECLDSSNGQTNWLAGIELYAGKWGGTGSVSSINGAYIEADVSSGTGSSVAGIGGGGYAYGNASVGSLNGVSTRAYVLSDAKTDYVYGVNSNVFLGTSKNTIDATGLWTRVYRQSGGGTLTNAYGLYIDDVYGATNNYSLYSKAANPTVIRNDGKLGVGTASPSTLLQVSSKVVDDNGYTYDAGSLYVIHQTKTAALTLNDPKEVLLLARQGTNGQSYGAAASFRLSRYENAGTNSRTRLDLVLAHDGFLTSPTTALTIKSDGSLKVNGTINGIKFDRGLIDDETSIGIGLSTLSSTTTVLKYNTAVGYESMKFTTSGLRNIAVGTRTLYRNTTGIRNVAIGDSAMVDTLSGSDNIAIGTSALMGNASIGGLGTNHYIAIGDQALMVSNGSFNIGIGYDAGSTISGQQNIIIGNEAVGNQSTSPRNSGNNNLCIGEYAGYTISGSNNLVLGTYAGYDLRSASNNILLGYYAGWDIRSGSNNVFVGYNAGSSEINISDTFILTLGNNERMRINSVGNVGIGKTAPNSKLDVNGNTAITGNLGITGDITKINNVTTSFPTIQGAANSVLTNNGSGTLSWVVPVAGPSGTVTSIGATAPLQITGDAGVNPTIKIQDGTSSGDILKWNGSSWQISSNTTVGGPANSVQYNSGSAITGSSKFTYNDTVLALSGANLTSEVSSGTSFKSTVTNNGVSFDAILTDADAKVINAKVLPKTTIEKITANSDSYTERHFIDTTITSNSEEIDVFKFIIGGFSGMPPELFLYDAGYSITAHLKLSAIGKSNTSIVTGHIDATLIYFGDANVPASFLDESNIYYQIRKIQYNNGVSGISQADIATGEDGIKLQTTQSDILNLKKISLTANRLYQLGLSESGLYLDVNNFIETRFVGEINWIFNRIIK